MCALPVLTTDSVSLWGLLPRFTVIHLVGGAFKLVILIVEIKSILCVLIKYFSPHFIFFQVG